MKKLTKKTKEWHSSPNKIGMGDYYGTAIKQKTARLRDTYSEISPMTNKKMGTPPKSLA